MNLDLLAQYGILGVVAWGLYLFAQGAIKRERVRLDKAETENANLNKQLYDNKVLEDSLKREQDRADKAEASYDRLSVQYRDEVFPVLRTATDALKNVFEAVSTILKAQEKADIIRQYEEGKTKDGNKTQ